MHTKGARRRPSAALVAAALGAAVLALAAAGPAKESPSAVGAPAGKPGKQFKAPPGARELPEGWIMPRPRLVAPPALPEEVTRAYVIPIHGEINNTMADVVEGKVLRCKTGGAQIVIFDMDTPGGASDAMDRIVRLITEDLPGAYTVAYVHPVAASAGAIISLACNEIVMSPGGVIGDAMPIMLGPGGLVEIPEKERGKIESFARAIIRKLAERNGYDSLLCESMITITLEVWMVRDRATGEILFVDAEKWRGKVSGAPPTSQPMNIAPPTSAQYEYLSTVVGSKELLTMTATEAKRLGFTRHILASLEEVQEHYHIALPPTRLEDNWSERLVNFLTSPAVTTVLFFVAVLGIYMEFNAPGHIVPGAVAACCLAILFGSRYLIGMAQWWSIALFVLGVALVLLELLVIPGFGIPGILGILFCLVSLAAMLIPSAPNTVPIPHSPLEWRVFSQGAFALGVGLVAAAIAAWILSAFLPKIPVAGKLVLAPVSPASGPPVAAGSPMLRIHPGDLGVVESVCRPVGKVRFGGQLLDAASQGEIIEPPAKVRVLRQDGNFLIVEKA